MQEKAVKINEFLQKLDDKRNIFYRFDTPYFPLLAFTSLTA